MSTYRIFVSSVSDELGNARRAVARALRRKELEVRDQEYSRPGAATLLEKLRDDIAGCDAVICLVGERAGLFPTEAHVKALGPIATFEAYAKATGEARASLTQWEFLLAKHLGKKRYVFLTAPDFVPDKPNSEDEPLRASQRAYRAWLYDTGEHYSTLGVQAALIEDVLVQDFPTLKLRRPNSLPYASLGPLFKGRERTLAELHRSLARGGHDGQGAASAIIGTANALHGLGGIGKTRLAVEYAWHHARDYSAHLFVGAETPDALRRNLAAQCGRLILDLPEQEAKEEEARVAAVLGWLQRNDNWLIILDNADTKEAAAAVQALLPQLANGCVLITGRWSEWSAAVKPLPLDVLAADDAATFLLERTEARRRKADDDASQARALAGELGCLTLALEQAGAYIARHKLTFAAYLAAWQQNRAKVMGWFDEHAMQYPRSVATTWQTSFERLGAPARRLLQRLAWLSPEPVPESLLDVAVPGDAAGHDLRAALAELDAFSLVARAGDAPAFTVHRLVQVSARTAQDAPGRTKSLAEALAWIDAAFVGDHEDVRSWPTLDPLAPHADSVSRHADEAGIGGPVSEVMDRLASLLGEKGLFRQIVPLRRRALAIGERNYGLEHPNVATLANNLALVLKEVNELDEAERLLQRALAIDTRVFGPDSGRAAVALSNLASVLIDRNRHREAEPLARHALGAAEASFGPDHPRVAGCLSTLARLLRETERPSEAEGLIRRALVIEEKSYGAQDPRVSATLTKLAQLLQENKRFAEAEPLMRQGLAVTEGCYGPEHPLVANRLSALAVLLRLTGRSNDALPLAQRALAIIEKSHGPDHPLLGICLHNVAKLLQESGDLDEAEPLMRRQLEILARAGRQTGGDHPHIRLAADSYVAVLKAMGKGDTEIAAAVAAALGAAATMPSGEGGGGEAAPPTSSPST
jgi:tetratricopeptide (TPR) repeat protein